VALKYKLLTVVGVGAGGGDVSWLLLCTSLLRSGHCALKCPEMPHL